MTAPVAIDIVSDVMCPWCFVGKRRLGTALEGLGVPTEVRWHPFQLDATLPPDGKDRAAYLNEKFGGPDRAGEVYARIGAAGEAEGIAFAFDKIMKSPNTLNAHRVIRWAGIGGVQDAVVERLFRAFFQEGADLSDNEALAGLAEEAGLDHAMVTRLLATDADLAETEADVAHARAMGVTGVPCFILDRKYAVPGAQPADVLATAIRKVVAQRTTEGSAA